MEASQHATRAYYPRVFAVAVAAGCLSGCFPMRFVESPGAVGHVIDAETKLPVQSASISLKLVRPSNDEVPRNTFTDLDGMFVIEPVKRWGIYIVPMDFVGFSGVLSIDAQGYEPTSKELRSSPAGFATTNYGDLPLMKRR